MTWNPQVDGSREFTGGDRCPRCGKIRLLTRKAAKKVAKSLNRRRPGHLSVYRCGDFFHVGHLPASVIAGDQSRDDIARGPVRHMKAKTAAPGEGAC